MCLYSLASLFIRKNVFKRKKKCVNSSASFSNRGNLFKEKRKNSIFLVTAHFVLSMVTVWGLWKDPSYYSVKSQSHFEFRCVQLFDNLFYSGIDSLLFKGRKPGENLLNNGGKSIVAWLSCVLGIKTVFWYLHDFLVFTRVRNTAKSRMSDC